MAKYRFIVTCDVDDEEASSEYTFIREDLKEVVESYLETATNIRCTVEDEYCIEKNDKNFSTFVSREAKALEDSKNEYYASAKIILNHLESHKMVEKGYAHDITSALMIAVNCLLEKGGEAENKNSDEIKE